MILKLLIPRAIERFQGLVDGDGAPAAGGFMRDAQAVKFGQSVADFEIGFDTAAVLEPGFGGRIDLLSGRAGKPAAPEEPPGEDDLAELLLLGLGQQVIDHTGVVVEILKIQMPCEAKLVL